MSSEAPTATVQRGPTHRPAAGASGIDTMFTLSGGHLFSIYDGCAQRASG